MSFVVKIGKDLNTLTYRQESIGKVTDSGINSWAKVLGREEELFQKRNIRIHLGLENITLSETG